MFDCETIFKDALYAGADPSWKVSSEKENLMDSYIRTFDGILRYPGFEDFSVKIDENRNFCADLKFSLENKGVVVDKEVFYNNDFFWLLEKALSTRLYYVTEKTAGTQIVLPGIWE